MTSSSFSSKGLPFSLTKSFIVTTILQTKRLCLKSSSPSSISFKKYKSTSGIKVNKKLNPSLMRKESFQSLSLNGFLSLATSSPLHSFLISLILSLKNARNTLKIKTF